MALKISKRKKTPVVEVEDDEAMSPISEELPGLTDEASEPEESEPEAVEEETDANPEIATLEERINRIASMVETATDALENVPLAVSEEVKRVSPRLLDVMEMRVAALEHRLLLRVLDYFNQCPFFDLLKVADQEKSRVNGEDLFAKAFRDGWRFIGNFTNPRNAADHYSLFCRPAGGPITDGEYLKHYEEWMKRRDKYVEQNKPVQEMTAKDVIDEAEAAKKKLAKKADKAPLKVKKSAKK